MLRANFIWMHVRTFLILLKTGLSIGDACRGQVYYQYFEYVYCEKGCCGYMQVPTCCTTNFETVVGAVFGSLLFTGLCLVGIVCWCNKRSKGCIFVEPVGVIRVQSEPSVVFNVTTEECQVMPATVIKPPPYTRDPPPAYSIDPSYI